MKEIDYTKKIKKCEILGAKKFQKCVYKIEELKWKAIKKLFPNYIKFCDKRIEKIKNKRIKKAKNQDEIDAIKRNAVLQKMILRKEYNKRENMNYHINKNRPSEFLRELNWNKEIHKRNLIWNSVLLPASIVASIAGFWIAIPFSVYEVVSTFINFQCVNIQNYNIYRIKRIENKLKEKEIKQEQKQIEDYKEVYELIGKKIEEKKELVDINEIVNNISSIEQLKKMRELIINEQNKRKGIIDIKGGKRK